jgi:hypothetical protein
MATASSTCSSATSTTPRAQPPASSSTATSATTASKTSQKSPASRAVPPSAAPPPLINADGWPDIFLTSPDGKNQLFLNDTHGKFLPAPGAAETFLWKNLGPDNPPTGVCIADINRDGLPDIVIGHHNKRPWIEPAPIRLYLNRGTKNGRLAFEDITQPAGLAPLAMKAPHLEIQDFDNDGWPDVFVSIVKFKDGKPSPLIYRNLGPKDGIPHFREDTWSLNDFPTPEDKAAKSTGPFYKKMLADKKIMYTASAPTCDYDRDGRLDIFLANWWIDSDSMLLHNQTAGGNYLDVQLQGDNGVNRMGIGSRISIFTAGKMRDPAALLGSREIAIGYGWCSGQEAVAHFGLAAESAVDIEVILPHGKGTLERKNVKANQRITLTAIDAATKKDQAK